MYIITDDFYKVAFSDDVHRQDKNHYFGCGLPWGGYCAGQIESGSCTGPHDGCHKTCHPWRGLDDHQPAIYYWAMDDPALAIRPEDELLDKLWGSELRAEYPTEKVNGKEAIIMPYDDYIGWCFEVKAELDDANNGKATPHGLRPVPQDRDKDGMLISDDYWDADFDLFYPPSALKQ